MNREYLNRKRERERKREIMGERKREREIEFVVWDVEANVFMKNCKGTIFVNPPY